MSCLECNDCNESPIYPVNTALPGPPGVSAYVYVAFADTVANVGTPGSTSTGGFVNTQPLATSAFFAILTTNTPIAAPVAANFNGLWVPLTGITLTGINLEDGTIPVAGGPFNTINFQGVGLTGVTVTNNGAFKATVDIITAGLIKTTYASFITLIQGNLLAPGASYWIIDAGDGEGSKSGTYKAECSATYYTDPITSSIHNTGIIVRAAATNKFDTTAIYLARVPNPGYTMFFKGATYVANTYVVSYNQVFKCLNNGTYSVEPAEDPTNWLYIERDNTTYYTTEPQFCLYSVPLFAPFDANSGYGTVRSRWDSKGNLLSNTNTTPSSNEFIKKCFRWGYPSNSKIHNNTINFWDDSTRPLVADTFRTPAFVTNSHRINYGTVMNFYNNKIDIDTPGIKTNTLVLQNTGTRFFDVYIGSSAGEISGNTFNNAVVANIYATLAPVKYINIINNTINDSVLYNINFTQCIGNTITNNSVIGDIAYTDNSAYSSPANILNRATFSTVTTNNLLQGVGGKFWNVADANATITNVGGDSVITFPANVTTTQVNDILYFNTCAQIPSLNGTYHTILPSTTYTAVIGDIFAVAPAGNINVYIYHPSIQTSFATFNYNVITNSTIRGINKDVTNSTVFSSNEIKKSLLENYVTHPEPPNPIFVAPYNNPGNEYLNFTSNNISYSAFYGNKIGLNGFYNNIIKSVTFANNISVGFEGYFRSNDIAHEAGTGFEYTGMFAFRGTSFRLCSFEQFTDFSGNLVKDNNYFYYVRLQGSAGSGRYATVNFNRFVGVPYDNSAPGTIYFKSPGLSNVVFKPGVAFNNNTFEGRNAALADTTLDVKTDYGIIKTQAYGISSINRLTFRDFRLESSGKLDLVPQLFGNNANPIRGVTASELVGTRVNTTLGAITYRTSSYSLSITTEFPHLINIGAHSGKLVNILLTLPPLWLVSTSNPNGIYYNPAYVISQATITAVTNDYTFVCTVTQAQQYQYTGSYFLAGDNITAVDGVGASNPIGGAITSAISGTYNDNTDTLGNVRFPSWYKPFFPTLYDEYTTSAINSVISGNSFEPQLRIALNNPAVTYSSAPIDRRFYGARDYTAAVPTIPFYTVASKLVQLPFYFDSFSSTVIFGSATAGTYEVTQINFMPDKMPVKFVTMPGCTIQFNLTAVAAATSNQILKDGAATTITMKSYYKSGSLEEIVYDEVVLMKEGNLIKVVSKIINQ